MKIEYGINKLARVSFETRGMTNPMSNIPMKDKDGKQRIEDVWEPIDTSTARALEEILRRVEALETALDVKNTEKTIQKALDIVAIGSPNSGKPGRKKKAS